MSLYDGGILALDLATVTGWCYGPPGKMPLMFGSLRFGKTGDPRPVIYRELRAWLNDWIINKKPDLVVFESAAVPMTMQGHTNANTIKRLIGMCEMVEELCYDRVELREATVAQVRAHFIGSNRMKREQAKEEIKRRCRQFGWEVENDNEGDACALWSYQVCCLRPDLAFRHTPLYASR